MRPRKTEATGSGDLFRARLDQIIDMQHELVRLADAIDWDWMDGELAGRFSLEGRPATETRFMVGLLLLKHIYRLSDEGVCARWVENPYFQYFTGEEFFQHAFPHKRSGLSHWRKLAQLAEKLGISVAYLSRIERDRENAPKDDLIRKICKALGINCDEAYAEARRLPPDLRNHAYEVIAAYRKSQKKD